jgi:hypothetical protein
MPTIDLEHHLVYSVLYPIAKVLRDAVLIPERRLTEEVAWEVRIVRAVDMLLDEPLGDGKVLSRSGSLYVFVEVYSMHVALSCHITSAI